MPIKTHIEDSRQLIDMALKSARVRQYDESRLLIRLALHLILEDVMNQDLEEAYNDLQVWEELKPTPKRLEAWNSKFQATLEELRKDEESLAFVKMFDQMFVDNLVSSQEAEACREQVDLFIEAIIESLKAADEEHDSGKEILSTADVGKMFGVTSQTVLSWCKEGRMPGAYQTPGGTWRIPRKYLGKIERLLAASSELEAYIPDQETVNETVSKRRRSWRG